MSESLQLENPCPKCGKHIKPGLKYCNYCGINLGQYKMNCPKCGKSIKMGLKFCNYCGINLVQQKRDKIEITESKKGIEVHQIVRVIGGFILLLSAFLHLLFMWLDPMGGFWYYWILGDPEQYTGLDVLVAGILGILIALFLSIVHAVIYFIMGGFLLSFKKNRAVPSLTIVFSLIGIGLGLRSIILYGYTSDFLQLLIIIDIVVLAISIYSIIAPSV